MIPLRFYFAWRRVSRISAAVLEYFPRRPFAEMELRPYQREAVEKAASTNTIINLPTGFGKTLIGVHVLKRFQGLGRLVFAVPEDHLQAPLFSNVMQLPEMDVGSGRFHPEWVPGVESNRRLDC